MSFCRRPVRAPHKVFDSDRCRDLASIAAPDIESQDAGDSLAICRIAQFTIEPVALRELLLAGDGVRPGALVPLLASELRQRNEDKRIGFIALQQAVEIGTLLARLGNELETINPQANFQWLILVLFFRHAMAQCFVNVAGAE